MIIGLLAAQRLGLSASGTAVQGALAKLDRLLPETQRVQVQAMQDFVSLGLSPAGRDHADAATILQLSTAARDRTGVRLTYRSAAGETTERIVDPYGVAFQSGHWYLVCFDHLPRRASNLPARSDGGDRGDRPDLRASGRFRRDRIPPSSDRRGGVRDALRGPARSQPRGGEETGVAHRRHTRGGGGRHRAALQRRRLRVGGGVPGRSRVRPRGVAAARAAHVVATLASRLRDVGATRRGAIAPMSARAPARWPIHGRDTSGWCTATSPQPHWCYDGFRTCHAPMHRSPRTSPMTDVNNLADELAEADLAVLGVEDREELSLTERRRHRLQPRQPARSFGLSRRGGTSPGTCEAQQTPALLCAHRVRSRY